MKKERRKYKIIQKEIFDLAFFSFAKLFCIDLITFNLSFTVTKKGVTDKLYIYNIYKLL